MVEEKERLMGDARPVCRLTRRGLDLSDSAARAVLFDEVADTTRSALVITEGLLLYMTEDVVRALALDLAGRPSIRWCVFDLASPNLLQMMQKTMGMQFATTGSCRGWPRTSAGSWPSPTPKTSRSRNSATSSSRTFT